MTSAALTVAGTTESAPSSPGGPEIWAPTSEVLINISGQLFNLTDLIDAKTRSNAELSDDAIWILTSTFIIFTMQSGFGLLESGSVSTKNEANIMVKNAMDVIFGGLTYWLFGYAFSFGETTWVTPFNGWGNFVAETDGGDIGEIYSKFFFQSSFATTATTIVSGSMAERTKLESYILFSTINTIVYCFPAHWVWAPSGWLNKLGMIDIAGAGPVHLCGGMTGLVATVMLKPRHKRYDSDSPPQMGSPTNALLGTFMLWWGWLGFNCGSTFGISGAKWKLAARSAMNTLNSSIGGGVMGTFLTSAITTLIASCAGGIFATVLSYVFKRKTFDITYLINGLLGSLVGITAFCALSTPWESFIIGLIGAAIAIAAVELVDKLKIDDPVGCVGVHGIGAIWGLLCVGLFAKNDPLNASLGYPTEIAGLFYGGGFYLVGVQLLGCVAISVWTIITSFLLLKAIDLTIGLRVPLEEELLGADIVEHGLGEVEYNKGSGLRRESRFKLGKRRRKKPGDGAAGEAEEGGISALVLSSSNSLPRELNSFTHRDKTGAFGAKRGHGPSEADLDEVAEIEGITTATPNNVTVQVVGGTTAQYKRGRKAGRVFSRLFRKQKFTPSAKAKANGEAHEMKGHASSRRAKDQNGDLATSNKHSAKIVSSKPSPNGSAPASPEHNNKNGNAQHNNSNGDVPRVAHVGQENDGYRHDREIH